MTTVPTDPARATRLRHIGRATVPVTVATALLTAALTGCSHSGRRVSGPTTRSTPTSPTSLASASSVAASPSAVTQAKQQAIDAYDAMWRDMAIAARTADYQSPLLPQRATGTALATLIHGLYAYKRQGVIIKGTPIPHPRATSASPVDAPVRVGILDCFDDTHWLNYKATGGLQDDIPGGHRRVTAMVVEHQDQWKVAELSVGDEGSC